MYLAIAKLPSKLYRDMLIVNERRRVLFLYTLRTIVMYLLIFIYMANIKNIKISKHNSNINYILI